MMEVILYFAIGLGLIGVPSFVFYRLGIDIGVTKGVRKQLIRELMHSGILEEGKIKSLWKEHQDKSRDHSVFFWGLMMLGLWGNANMTTVLSKQVP